VWTKAVDKKYQTNGNFKYNPGTYIQSASGCWWGKCTFCVENKGLCTCNANKGNNKKIVPKVKPHKPTYWELVDKRRGMPFDIRHPEWAVYLGVEQ
jgi:hypothetical protein